MGWARAGLIRGSAVAGALAIFTAASARVAPERRPTPELSRSQVSSTPEQGFPEPALCFAPGTSNEVVRRASLRASRVAGFGRRPYEYYDGSRWSCTAMDGCGHGQGQPTNLTWSIVPDGTPVAGFAGEDAAPSNLRSFLNSIYGSESAWMAHFQTVFGTWNALTGITFVHVTADDSAALPDSEGVVGVRADIRIGGHYIDGNFNILAYNFFPNGGDMVIDTGDSFYSGSGGLANGSLGFRNMLAHEIGHGMGIYHVCPVDGTKLMEPFLSTNFVHAQADDKLAAWRGYGDDKEDNDSIASATNLGVLSLGSFGPGEVSLDDDADVDYYRFTVPVGKKAAFSLNPLFASPYFAGPQASNGLCGAATSFNPMTVQDLAFEVRGGPGGSNLLASVNAQPAGGFELTNVTFPAPGEYFIRVYSATTGDGVQGYGLGVQISNALELSIDNVSAFEGDSGTKDLVFRVKLAPSSSSTVTVSAVTSNLTATAGSDYTAAGPTTITFAPGQTSREFRVPIHGDTDYESKETFQVTLSGSNVAAIGDGIGIGEILNDDLASRTFISASGNDANECANQSTPCRFIQAAASVTALDGEVIILSSGTYSYASVFLGNGVKITAATGIVAAVPHGFLINGLSGTRYVLRGLTITGTGGCCGVTVQTAGSISIEDSTVQRWSKGLVLAGATPTQVTVLNTVFRANGVAVSELFAASPVRGVIAGSQFVGNATGIEIAAGGLFDIQDSTFVGSTASGIVVGPGVADVFRSEFTANAVGLSTLAGGTARIGRSHIFGNTTGLLAGASSTLASFGTNVIRGNGTDTSGTISLIPEQ